MKNKKTAFTDSLARKVKNRQRVEVHVDDLISNKVNPPERTETNKQFLVLKKGIRTFGVLQDIDFCGDTMTLINGHRRVKSAKENGIEKITGYMYSGLTPNERDVLFEHLNSTSVSYTGAQKLFTYLEGGLVNPEFEQVCLELMNNGRHTKLKDGRKCLIFIRNKKLSPNTYLIAVNEYCKITQDTSLKTKAQVMNWLMEIGNPNRLKDLIRLKCPAHLLEKAVRTGKPIAGTWTITAV